MSASDSLPAGPDALRALLLAERVRHGEEVERLTAIIKELQRWTSRRTAIPSNWRWHWRMWIGEFGVGAVAIQLQRAAESCEVLGRPCMFAVSPTSRAPSGGPAWRTAARCSRGCAAPDEQRIAAHKAAPCVSTAATGPSRNLFVDGGQPTGKKKSTDNLNVFYTGQKPKIIHSTATQNPDAGLVTLDYGTARFVVQYDDIEQVVIRKN